MANVIETMRMLPVEAISGTPRYDAEMIVMPPRDGTSSHTIAAGHAAPLMISSAV